MFTNVDVRGVPRGRCGGEHCECDGFTRSYTEAYGGASGWCCYCGHPPVSHSRIERNVFGRQEIFPVIWNGARPPTLDPPTRREWSGMLEAAQPTTDEVVVLEPDEEVRETAEPENEAPEVIVLPAEEEQSDQNLGLTRENCDEDTPSLDASTLGNSDLLQKVENLENEIKELKKRQNEEGMLSTTLATLVEHVKKVEQFLAEQASSLEDNSSETSPKESPRQKPRSARSGLKNRLRPSAARWVKIGEGVTLKKEQLEKIWKMPNLTATKFVRQLCKAVFTPQGLQGKCLKKTGRSGNRKVLDPVRLNAIIGYTCSKFNADRRDLRLAISYMLCHLSE